MLGIIILSQRYKKKDDSDTYFLFLGSNFRLERESKNESKVESKGYFGKDQSKSSSSLFRSDSSIGGKSGSEKTEIMDELSKNPLFARERDRSKSPRDRSKSPARSKSPMTRSKSPGDRPKSPADRSKSPGDRYKSPTINSEIRKSPSVSRSKKESQSKIPVASERNVPLRRDRSSKTPDR